MKQCERQHHLSLKNPWSFETLMRNYKSCVDVWEVWSLQFAFSLLSSEPYFLWFSQFCWLNCFAHTWILILYLSTLYARTACEKRIHLREKWLNDARHLKVKKSVKKKKKQILKDNKSTKTIPGGKGGGVCYCHGAIYIWIMVHKASDNTCLWGWII